MSEGAEASTDLYASIADSGDLSQGRRYQYRYYNDTSVQSPYDSLLLVIVGTSMSVKDYPDLCKKTVLGRSVVMAMVDNSPAGIFNPGGGAGKLNGARAAAAFNDLVDNLGDRFNGLNFAPDKKVVVGGHSAGGAGAIYSLPSNSPDALTFEPSGYIGIDPFGTRRFPPSPSITTQTIAIPSLAWGFTTTTCAVDIDEAGKAAYNVSQPTHRVFNQIINKKLPGQGQITHCIFADGGCIACPAHAIGAWVRQQVANSIWVFVSSLSGTTNASKTDYENAIDADYQDKVNVYWNTDEAN